MNVIAVIQIVDEVLSVLQEMQADGTMSELEQAVASVISVFKKNPKGAALVATAKKYAAAVPAVAPKPPTAG
jgi:hypothetical protein